MTTRTIDKAIEPIEAPTDDIERPDQQLSSLALWFLAGPLVSDQPVRHIPIATSPYLVGRRSSCEIQLASRAVSSRHAELRIHAEGLSVVDLNSTNGTFVNGRRIEGEVMLPPDSLVQFADVPYRVLEQNSTAQTSTVSQDSVDQALALVQFETLMSQQAVTPHFQPIVSLADSSWLGFEVLGRSRLPGLETPYRMFSVASQLKMEIPLSEMLRVKGVEQSRSLGETPHLFLNTHPLELHQDGGLIESVKSLRLAAGSQPFTLEIHEGAVAELQQLKALRAALCDLDVKLAFDDFGAGQSRLVELLELHPDYVKFDMSLIRGIDQASSGQRQMIGLLVKMVSDIGAVPLAEGIETEPEARVCREIGFELAQGYFFGRPAPLWPA